MKKFIGRDLSGSTWRRVDLRGARMRAVDLSGLRISGADALDVRIDADVDRFVLNGVDVVPLVEAELRRRDPDRALLDAHDVESVGRAYAMLERRWEALVGRARRLPAAVLHESVDGEWSFIEILRHLVFATESWVHRPILGQPTPWHALSLPWDEAPDDVGVLGDRAARPGLDEVLEVRAARQGDVRRLLADLTQEQYAASVTPPGPGWPRPEPVRVAQCLAIVLHEEWEHHRQAERDLTVFETWVVPRAEA